MKSNKIIKIFVFFLESIIFLSLFIYPINTVDEPISSQVDLKIIIAERLTPTIVGIIDDFLADPLGSGVNSVEVVSSGIKADDQHSYLVEQMILNSTEFDVIGLDTIWLAQFAENKWVIELDSRLNLGELDNYVDGMVDSCIYKGKAFAYPYFMNLGILFYRKDLIETYNFTEADFDTWSELNTTANYILKGENIKSKNPDLVGYVGQFDAYEGGVVNFFEWTGSYGATNLITSEGDVNINNSEVREAMTFLQALVSQQSVGVQETPTIIPYEGVTMDESSSVDKWLAGESIFMRQWTFAYTNSIDNNISFGVIPIPTATGSPDEKSSCVGGAILTIPTHSQNKDAAWNFTRFLGDKVAQEFELMNASNFPALKSVYDNPPSGYEWIKNWTDQLSKTLARPVHPKYTLISSVIAQNFNDLLKYNKDVNTALNDMEKEILNILVEEDKNQFFKTLIIIISIITTGAIAIVILLYIRKTIRKSELKLI